MDSLSKGDWLDVSDTRVAEFVERIPGGAVSPLGCTEDEPNAGVCGTLETAMTPGLVDKACDESGVCRDELTEVVAVRDVALADMAKVERLESGTGAGKVVLPGEATGVEDKALVVVYVTPSGLVNIGVVECECELVTKCGVETLLGLLKREDVG